MSAPDSNDLATTRRRGGRPSKLTPDVVARILSSVRCGASNVAACAAAGISPNTLARWMRLAKTAKAPRKYRRLARKLEKARHEGNVARLAIIQKAAPTDWRAAAWLLERLVPQQFSMKHQVQHSGRLDAPVDQRAIAAIFAVPGLLEQLDEIALTGAPDNDKIDELMQVDWGGEPAPGFRADDDADGSAPDEAAS